MRRTFLASWLALLACVVGVACSTSGEEVDAADAGESLRDTGFFADAHALDAGELDASTERDAGEEDASALDASEEDASTPDSGWGGCSVNGVPGNCVDVAQCTGDHQATPGHCPGPAEIQCCTPRGASFSCDPAVMPAPNAGLVEAPGSDGCAPGMLRVDTFCIDRYEASLELVHQDGTTEVWSPYHHPGSQRVRARSIADAVPQGYVDQVVATAACAEAGKRLCTNAEWLRACRGPSGTIYPYGDTRMDGVCNDARAVHPAVELFPNDPNPFARIQDACINQLPDSLDHTGANPGCVTAEGAFDMMGNLHEWTDDPAGTFRGGFYVDTVRNGNGCLYATTAHDTHHWDYSTGFRCCADP